MTFERRCCCCWHNQAVAAAAVAVQRLSSSWLDRGNERASWLFWWPVMGLLLPCSAIMKEKEEETSLDVARELLSSCCIGRFLRSFFLVLRERNRLLSISPHVIKECSSETIFFSAPQWTLNSFSRKLTMRSDTLPFTSTPVQTLFREISPWFTHSDVVGLAALLLFGFWSFCFKRQSARFRFWKNTPLFIE